MKISRETFIRSLIGMLGTGIWLRQGTAFGKNCGRPVHRTLGATGITVTALGFGASRTMEPALVRAALDGGIRFIDTGRSYANGQNEVMIGNVLKGIRKEYVIQSKITLPENFGKNTGSKFLTTHLERQLGESLVALRTDFVDVMLLHGIQDEWILEHHTIREFLSRAKTTGKINAFGFSTHRNHLDLLENAIKTGFYNVVMLPFNPFGGFRHSVYGWTTQWDQERLIQLLGKAHASGIGIVAMKTCSGGPFACREGRQPTMAGAVKWVTEKPYISTAAVAMGNFSELDEHLWTLKHSSG